MRLESETVGANLDFVIEFIDLGLTNIIHHRNQLKNYRNTMQTFNSMFNAVSIDVDFSEKLKVPLKYEPRSMHWTGVEIIVHSSCLHVFVNITLEEMLSEVEVKNDLYIVISSNNCAAQYKSASHFDDIQKISDRYNTKVICCYGIPGHGKGGVDHVGELTNVAIRREVAAG